MRSYSAWVPRKRTKTRKSGGYLTLEVLQLQELRSMLWQAAREGSVFQSPSRSSCSPSDQCLQHQVLRWLRPLGRREKSSLRTAKSTCMRYPQQNRDRGGARPYVVRRQTNRAKHAADQDGSLEYDPKLVEIVTVGLELPKRERPQQRHLLGTVRWRDGTGFQRQVDNPCVPLQLLEPLPISRLRCASAAASENSVSRSSAAVSAIGSSDSAGADAAM
jgi:hypothetical protein